MAYDFIKDQMGIKNVSLLGNVKWDYNFCNVILIFYGIIYEQMI